MIIQWINSTKKPRPSGRGDSLDKVSSTDELIDMSISILQEAKSNGFSGFGGMCAQATVIINELLFDGKQVNFASFNNALEKKNQYIGHVACLVELNADEYVILMLMQKLNQ